MDMNDRSRIVSALRSAAGSLTASSPEKVAQARRFQEAYGALREALEDEQEDTAELWIEWREFYRAAKGWSEFIIDNLAIPRRRAKALEMAVRLFRITYGRGKGPRPSIAAWYAKNATRFEVLNEAAGWPERSEEDGGTLTHGKFIIHNTIGASDKDLKEVMKVIDITMKAIPKTGISDLKQMAYGSIYLVGQIERKNWAAWYMEHKDVIYLRPKVRGQTSPMVARTLLHELTHRYWNKKLSRKTKVEWLQHHNDMGSVSGQYRIPEVGEVLGLKVNNKTVRVDRYEGSKAFLVNTKNDTLVGTVTKRKISQWMAELDHKAKYPSIYAATEYEEHFCEAVAHKGMGTLSEENLMAFDEIVLGKRSEMSVTASTPPRFGASGFRPQTGKDPFHGPRGLSNNEKS